MKKIYPILFALMLSLVAAQAVTYTTITATTLTGNAGVKAPTSWVTLQGNASYDQILWPDNYDLLIGVNVTGVQGTSTVRPLNVTYGTSAGAFRGSIGNLSVQMAT
jgi:hypothetical protein